MSDEQRKKTDDELIAMYEERIRAAKRRKQDKLRRDKAKRDKALAETADAMTVQQFIATANAHHLNDLSKVGQVLALAYEDKRAESAAADDAGESE